MNGASRTAKGTAQPVDLIVENAGLFGTDLDYRDGLKCPVLERNGKEGDLLEEILKPMAKQA